MRNSEEMTISRGAQGDWFFHEKANACQVIRQPFRRGHRAVGAYILSSAIQTMANVFCFASDFHENRTPWSLRLCHSHPSQCRTSTHPRADFFTVPTALFHLLYVFFVIHHGRQKILHFNITFHRWAQWVIQQLREAFPFDRVPKYLLFDRDSILSNQVFKTVKSFGIKPTRIAHRSPWQNGVCERWIGSCRRALLDHVVVLNEDHVYGYKVRQYVPYGSRWYGYFMRRLAERPANLFFFLRALFGR
jgi:hypothetical protein